MRSPGEVDRVWIHASFWKLVPQNPVVCPRETPRLDGFCPWFWDKPKLNLSLNLICSPNWTEAICCESFRSFPFISYLPSCLRSCREVVKSFSHMKMVVEWLPTSLMTATLILAIVFHWSMISPRQNSPWPPSAQYFCTHSRMLGIVLTAEFQHPKQSVCLGKEPRGWGIGSKKQGIFLF